jgi:hypothetical protein
MLFLCYQSYYGNNIGNIPDAIIGNLNSIVQGFVATDCLQLRITSTNTISNLGLLKGFSSNQVLFYN